MSLAFFLSLTCLGSFRLGVGGGLPGACLISGLDPGAQISVLTPLEIYLIDEQDYQTKPKSSLFSVMSVADSKYLNMLIYNRRDLGESCLVNGLNKCPLKNDEPQELLS